MDKFLCQNGSVGIDDYNTTGDNHVCEVTVTTDENNVTVMNGIPNQHLESGRAVVQHRNHTRSLYLVNQ